MLHTVEYIGDQNSLAAMIGRIQTAPVLALDIETINWWDRDAERVALLQLAFWEEGQVQTVVIDMLAGLNLDVLRMPLELSLQIKAIHNASYDAIRLARHFNIFTSPIYDTMLAARRAGEKKCSLQAQVAAHLGIELDKTEQRGDWGRRPLSREQLDYAAMDATCTLMLYERQIQRSLRGDYEVPRHVERNPARQSSLPLSDNSHLGELRISPAEDSSMPPAAKGISSIELEAATLALLGIVTELSGRYSPEQLATSVGNERIGLAGWIVDRVLGIDEDIDENAAKQRIAALCADSLVQISPSRRLEATTEGARAWQQNKPQ
ncbi:MAG: ribonuclease D [Blastocatellia bacterium]